MSTPARRWATSVAAWAFATVGAATLFSPSVSAQTTPSPDPEIPAANVTTALPGSAPSAPAPADAAAPTRPSAFALWARTEAIATDNGTLSPRGQERRDLIGALSPRLTFFRKGEGLSVDVDASVTARAYANNSQPDRVVPDVRAFASATLVERWLYLDASARAQEVEPDPFSAPLGGVADARGRTARALSITPALRRDLTATTSITANHAATVNDGATGTDSRRTEHASLARFAIEPRPLGGDLEWTRRDSRGNLSSSTAPGRTVLEQLRARGTLQVGGEIDLILHAGTERSRLEDGSDERDTIAGAGLRWHPSQRTEARVVVERRFFGTGGGLSFTHRMPFLATTIEASRGPQQADLSTATPGFGTGLDGMLDAMLTTRHTDEGERRALVDAEILQRGLATGLADARRVESGALQLVTRARIAFALMGLRNIVSVSAYAQDARRLERDTGASAASAVAIGRDLDHRQFGAQVDASHRLSPLLSMQAGWRWSKVDGLGDRDGQHSRTMSWNASLTRRLGPRTIVSGGIQHQRFDTNAAGQQAFDATALLVGMSHRF